MEQVEDREDEEQVIRRWDRQCGWARYPTCGFEQPDHTAGQFQNLSETLMQSEDPEEGPLSALLGEVDRSANLHVGRGLSGAELDTHLDGHGEFCSRERYALEVVAVL